jgi:hypothetical protein
MEGEGAGRPVGSLNKYNKTVKEQVLTIFDKFNEGEDDGRWSLETWAKNNLTLFYTKVLDKFCPVIQQTTHKIEGNISIQVIAYPIEQRSFKQLPDKVIEQITTDTIGLISNGDDINKSNVDRIRLSNDDQLKVDQPTVIGDTSTAIGDISTATNSSCNAGDAGG